jgi:hypothetical protein
MHHTRECVNHVTLFKDFVTPTGPRLPNLALSKYFTAYEKNR